MQRKKEVRKLIKQYKNLSKDIVEEQLLEDPRAEVYFGYNYPNLDLTDTNIEDAEEVWDSLGDNFNPEANTYICKWGMPAINGIIVDQDYRRMRDVSRVQLDILRELKRVCDSNGIKLFAIYGTLLGTVRCGGLLDGDDDIDVALMRDDYNKLIELAKQGVLNKNYFLQTPENDNCFFGGYLKLRRSDTTAINPQNWWPDCNEGIFIDIFPIDRSFKSRFKEWKKLKTIKLYQRMLYTIPYGYSPRFLDMPLLVWKGYKYLAKLFSKESLCDKLTQALSSGDEAIFTNKYGIYAHYFMKKGKPLYYSAEGIKNAKELLFEDIKVWAFSDYIKILKKRYGEGYIEPIQYNMSKERHGFYSTKHPYKYYKEKFGLLKNISKIDNPIILIGNERVIDKFRKQYPAVLFGSTYNNVNSYINDIHAHNEDVIIMICDYNPRTIEKTLLDNGITNYYFYWENRNWMLRANIASIYDEIYNMDQ